MPAKFLKVFKISNLVKVLILPLLISCFALIFTYRLLSVNNEIFLFFFIGIIISSWIGRMLGGFVSLIVSIIFIDYFIINKLHQFSILSFKDQILIVILILISIITIILIESHHRYIEKAGNILRDALDLMNYGFIVIDLKCLITDINSETALIFELPKSLILNKNLFEIIPELKQTELYYNLKDLSKGKIILSFDFYSNKTKKWFKINTISYSNNRLGIYLKDISDLKEQEKIYRKTQLYFERMLDSNIIGLVFSYSSGEIISANDSFLKMVGYESKDIENKILTWDKISLEKYKYLDDQINNQILQSGVSNIIQKEYLTKDGKTVPVMLGVTMINPFENLCLSFVVDITQKENIEKKYKESEEKFKTLVNSINDVVILLDEDRTPVGIYGQWLKTHNISESTFISKLLKEFPETSTINSHNNYYKRAFKGENVIYEWSMEDDSGSILYFQNSISPIYAYNKEIKQIVIVVRDISELENFQNQLNESNEKITNTLENITNAFIGLDNEWRFTYVNKQAEEYFKTERKDLLNKKIWDVFPELIGSKSYDLYHKAFDNQQTVFFEDRYMPSNHWFDIHLYPSKGGLTAYYTDINERKENQYRIESLLADIDSNKKRLDNIISNIPGIVWETWKPEEDNREKNFVSNYLKEMTGYETEEWLKSSKFWLKIMHPEDREKSWNKTVNIQRTGKAGRIQYRWITKDNKTIWTETHSAPIFNSEGNYIGMRGVTMNITDRKEIQQDLEESKEQLSVIFENVANGIIVQDSQGKIILTNNQALKYFGISSLANLTDKPNDILLFKEGSKTYDINTTRDGAIEDFSILPSQKALLGESYSEITLNFLHKLTKQQYWYDIKSRPIIDEFNKVQLIVTIIIDITDNREVEKRKDEFISIASHELKTPLTTIKAFTQILLNKFKKLEDNESAQYLGKMDKQVNRLTHIVSDLLDISKIEAGKLKLNKSIFDIGDLIKEVVDNLVVVTTVHNILILNNVSVKVNADRDQIEQVLINLINNAIKYSPDSDKVEIKVNIEKNYVIVKITDFGIGIDKNEQLKIFERFYMGLGTQKNRFFGLGLGLYISSEIIKMHKGKVWVNSALGKGSDFYFSLEIA